MAARKNRQWRWHGSGLRKLRGDTSQRVICRGLVERCGLDISEKTLSSWENGYTKPDADQLGALAEFFKVPASRFLATFYQRS